MNSATAKLHLYRHDGADHLSDAACKCTAEQLAATCKARVGDLADEFSMKILGPRGKVEAGMDTVMIGKLQALTDRVYATAADIDMLLNPPSPLLLQALAAHPRDTDALIDLLTAQGHEPSPPLEPADRQRVDAYAHGEFNQLNGQFDEVRRYLDAPDVPERFHAQLMRECDLFRAEVSALGREWGARRPKSELMRARQPSDDRTVDTMVQKGLIDWRKEAAAIERDVLGALANPPEDLGGFVEDIRARFDALRQQDGGVAVCMRLYRLEPVIIFDPNQMSIAQMLELAEQAGAGEQPAEKAAADDGKELKVATGS